MADHALGPVAIGVYTLLNVAGLTALVSTRIYEGIPRAPVYPFVWIECFGEEDMRGFGTGGLPLVDLRVHAFSSYEQHEGMKDAQAITAKVVELLKDKAVTITGYTHAGLVFYDRTTSLPNEVIEGVRVQEMVAQFRIYAEEA